jgi:hypothetical protein
MDQPVVYFPASPPPDRPLAVVAPLDWGLGHATRCVPIVRALLDRGWPVLLAADAGPLALLREAFPRLPWAVFPGARIRYPERGPLMAALAAQLPAFLAATAAERRWLAAVHARHPLGLVVSDNRYGARLPGVPSVLLTHQVSVRVPGLPGAGMAVHAALGRLMRPFDAVWIPDAPGPDNLSGALSSRYGLPRRARWIGALSRMAEADPVPEAWRPLTEGDPFDAVWLVSGPEPAAGRFRRALREGALLGERRVLLVEGRPDGQPGWSDGGRLVSVAHLPGPALRRVLERAPLALARSGYSTLMDLGVFGRKAVLVPTPGQSEQEYLARRCAAAGWAVHAPQEGLDAEAALAAAGASAGLPDFRRPALLDAALDAVAPRA